MRYTPSQSIVSTMSSGTKRLGCIATGLISEESDGIVRKAALV